MSSWRTTSADPNSRDAIFARRATLTATFAGRIRDRDRLFVGLASDAVTLDVGCVDQLPEGFAVGPLHRRIAAAARSVVGVDVNSDGVRELTAEGFDVLDADITSPQFRVGIGDRRFSLIIAGEIVEHILSLDAFFENCWYALEPGGLLVLSTPNPASWTLALPNGLGLNSDNVDHVLYLFPSGVVEIADRHGFDFSEWYGVNRLTSRKRLPGYILGRLVELFFRRSTAACQTVVYVLRRPET